MKKLALIIVLILSLVAAVPTQVQCFLHAGPGFRGLGHGFGCPHRPFPYYRPYPFYPGFCGFPYGFWYPGYYGYPYGLGWGYFGLAAFNSLVAAILGWQYLNQYYPYRYPSYPPPPNPAYPPPAPPPH
jgi:hypothetical protein